MQLQCLLYHNQHLWKEISKQKNIYFHFDLTFEESNSLNDIYNEQQSYMATVEYLFCVRLY